MLQDEVSCVKQYTGSKRHMNLKPDPLFPSRQILRPTTEAIASGQPDYNFAKVEVEGSNPFARSSAPEVPFTEL